MFLVQEVQEEGRHAIDGPGSPNAPEFPPEDYILRKYASRDCNMIALNISSFLVLF